MLVTMVAHANQPSDRVYHVGSSVRNPLRYQNLHDYALGYFKAKPWINKDGTTVMVGKITVLTNMASFQRYIFIRYLLPLKVLIYIILLITSRDSLYFFENVISFIIIVLNI